MNKTADTQVPILDLIADRWSPRAFQEHPVEREKIIGLMEAARWAASARNLQPWSFVIATRDQPDEHANLVHCLSTNNQRWAASAPLLIVVVAQVEHEGGQNRHAWYDVGLAVGNLTAQATHSGLALRQMGGFDRDRVRLLYGVPRSHEPVCVLAIGYRAEVDALPDDLRDRESSPRTRKPLSEFVFGGRWGKTSPVVGESAEV